MRRLGVIFLFSISLFIDAAAIQFDGNHLFTDKELSHLININKNDDTLISQIQSLYRSAGYFNVEINKSSDKNITINEGLASKIDTLTIDLIPPETHIVFEDLIAQYHGQVASEANLNELAEQCIARLAEEGMPFASAQWQDFGFDANGDIIAVLQIASGPLTRIADVRYRGLKRTRPETLNRLLNFKPGEVYSESKVEASEQMLDQMPYLRMASSFEIESLGDGDSCRVIYNVRELPSTRFDGAAGVASVKNKSSFVGRFDMEFGDILGTGRTFGFFWNKKDRFSSEIRLNYLEPYVLGSRLDLSLEAHQIDHDSLYIENGATLELAHQFGGGLGGALTLTIARTVPESGSSLAASNSRTVGMTFDYINTDHPDNPTGGYAIMTNVSHKYRSNSLGSAVQGTDTLGLPTQLTSAGAALHFFGKVSRRFVTALSVAGWGVVSNDGQAPADELRYLGGFESLRGYAERQIPAYRYTMATIEPRLVTGRESRAYLFCDLAEIKGGQSGAYHFFPGYGLGLVAPTSLGQFKLEVAWGKTGFPSDAILNFGLAGQF
jgi:translocation and assembly module TamA